MRITERRLRSLIRSTIKESYDDDYDAYADIESEDDLYADPWEASEEEEEGMSPYGDGATEVWDIDDPRWARG